MSANYLLNTFIAQQEIPLFHAQEYSGVSAEGRFLFLPRLAKHRLTLCLGVWGYENESDRGGYICA